MIPIGAGGALGAFEQVTRRSLLLGGVTAIAEAPKGLVSEGPMFGPKLNWR